MPLYSSGATVSESMQGKVEMFSDSGFKRMSLSALYKCSIFLNLLLK